MGEIKEKDTRPRYKAVCCNCGEIFYACKSVLQEWGMDSSGSGDCPGCDTFLNLTFDKISQTMKTKLWDVHVEELRKNKWR